MTTNTTLVSKHQLLDYVSKRDFNDFVAEMRDFRDETVARFESIDQKFVTIDKRFDAIDKRFNIIDRRLDKLEDSFRIQVGAVLDQFKEYVQITKEHMQGVEERLMKEIRGGKGK